MLTRRSCVPVADSFISLALTLKAWYPVRWALWMTWLTVRTLHLPAQNTQPTSFKRLSMEHGVLWLSAADMELRNSYMYGVDVIFHQQLLQVRLWHCIARVLLRPLLLLFCRLLMLAPAQESHLHREFATNPVSAEHNYSKSQVAG